LSPYIQSIILGIVEGLTEFLPVSSTAHLRIAEALMKIPLDDAYWKMYTIVIQLGAIIALCMLYLSRIVDFLRTFPEGEDGRHKWFNHPISLTLMAFVVTSATTLPLRKWSEKNLGSLTAIALALIVGGIIMWIVDVRSSRFDAGTTHVEEMTLLQALWIGLCQTLSAVFPGTSRSMSTIAAGQVAGLDRPSALEFSFLLSIPTMVAATAWDFIKEVHASKVTGAADAAVASAHVTMNGERWIVLLIGLVVSFIVALGVVEWFLHWVRRHGFTMFAIYRIILGGALLIWGAKYIAG
jgi:undecaprenyl-diphosphatase